MPYIDADTVKAKRRAIRALCKPHGVQVSVTKDGHSGVSVTFLSGPFDLRPNGAQDCDYSSINPHTLDWSWRGPYDGRDKARDLVREVYAIAREGKHTVTVDSDYGAVPNFYVWLYAGRFDKPYRIVEA